MLNSPSLSPTRKNLSPESPIVTEPNASKPANDAKKPTNSEAAPQEAFVMSTNNVSKKEFLRFFVYVVLLFLIIFDNFDVTNSYKQNNYIISVLAKSGTVDALFPVYTADLQTNLQLMMKFILDFNTEGYISFTDANFNNNQTIFLQNNLLILPITDIRIIQRRVDTVSNSSIIWKNPLTPLKTAYGPNNSYIFIEKDQAFTQFLPYFTLANTTSVLSSKASVDKWVSLLNNSFFDAHTQIVEIDFAFISTSLNILTYVHIINEILPSGVAKTTTDLRTFSYGFFGSRSTNEQKAVYIVYVMFFAYYFLVMFVKIYYDIKHVEIDEDMITNLNKRAKKINTLSEFSASPLKKPGKFKKFCEKCAKFCEVFKGPKKVLLRVFIGIKRFFSQTNNLLDLFVNIMNIFIITMTVELFNTTNFFDNYREISNNNNQAFIDRDFFANPFVPVLYDMNNKIQDLSQKLTDYQIYCALVALVQCFKILSFIISFSSSLQKFFTIISNIIDVLFFYILLIAVIFLSFVLLARNYYGYQIPIFTNIYSTSVYLFGMISGYNGYLNTMWENSPEFTLFFHIAYNFIIVFILMNMFLVIVKNEFSRFQGQIKTETDAQNSAGVSRFNYKPSLIYVLKEKFEKLQLFALKIFKKERFSQKQRELKEKELHLRNDMNLYAHINFDENFVEMLQMYEHTQIKNNMVEAEKKKVQQKLKLKSVKAIWQLIFLMIGLGTYIFLVTMFFQIPENYTIASSLLQTLHQPYEVPQMGSSAVASVTDVNNTNDVVYYLAEIFPRTFKVKYYYPADAKSAANYTVNESLIQENPCLNEFMFLINSEVRVTIRKRITYETQNYFKDVLPESIAPSFTYDSSKNPQEFTKNDVLEYITQGSYDNLGGYVFLANPVTEFSKKILQLNEQNFLRNDLNSIVVDFLLVNVLKNKYLYYLLVFQFGDGGGVSVIDLSLPFRRVNFQSVLDICITTLLLLMILIYFIYFLKFIKTVTFKAESYQTWHSMFIKHTIPESLLYHRERKNPEIFRKIAYVFDFKSLLNLLVFIFTGIFIALMIVLQVSVMKIEGNAKIFGAYLSDLLQINDVPFFSFIEGSGSYLNLSLKLMPILDMIALFASFSAFILVFQILYYYSKKKTFYVIIKSILIALREIPFMIAVLLAFLMTFAMYGYLLIGKFHEKFHTFPNAMRTLFEYLSSIDDIDYFMEESSLMPFLTLLLPFFLSVKLVILNMFFSIIYRAYEKTKKEGEKQKDEEFSLGFKEFWTLSLQIFKKTDEEKDNNLELYSQMLNKTDIEGLFIKMKDTIRFSNQNTNIHIWANICSEEIRNEFEKRSFLKEKCDEIMKNYFFKHHSGENKFSLSKNLQKKCVEYELRKNYWEYFRIAHQHLNRYDFYFRNRMVELNERLRKREIFDVEKEKQNQAMKLYIKDLMERFEENKRDIHTVKKQIMKLQFEKHVGETQQIIGSFHEENQGIHEENFVYKQEEQGKDLEIEEEEEKDSINIEKIKRIALGSERILEEPPENEDENYDKYNQNSKNSKGNLKSFNSAKEL